MRPSVDTTSAFRLASDSTNLEFQRSRLNLAFAAHRDVGRRRWERLTTRHPTRERTQRPGSSASYLVPSENGLPDRSSVCNRPGLPTFVCRRDRQGSENCRAHLRRAWNANNESPFLRWFLGRRLWRSVGSALCQSDLWMPMSEPNPQGTRPRSSPWNTRHECRNMETTFLANR